MTWAQNLLGFCLFACASQAPFSWVLPGGLQASKSHVAQRFALLEATFFLCFFFKSVPKATFRLFGSGVPRPDFARPKRLFFVDSKGNVKEFFGSGFGRFRLVSRWCLGLFGSKATACVLLLEAFGKWGNWLDDGFIGWACAGHVLASAQKIVFGGFQR